MTRMSADSAEEMTLVPAAHLPEGRRDSQKNLGQRDVQISPNTLADEKTGREH